jgi:C4-type Zn-finger protein
MMTDHIVPIHATHEATCPSCQAQGQFTYAGEQAIPPRVARAMGLNEDAVSLWHCPSCNSTISEPELLDAAS